MKPVTYIALIALACSAINAADARTIKKPKTGHAKAVASHDSGAAVQSLHARQIRLASLKPSLPIAAPTHEPASQTAHATAPAAATEPKSEEQASQPTPAFQSKPVTPPPPRLPPEQVVNTWGPYSFP
ncbi:hypothetical protein HNQ59_002138 [Chitinivorax tropicus]|uniref:Uncharacterized protein n=1 Tax=Chitinivorax tropicus TaxID=714531 RepID=A0A840MUJ1_9PROT|nr:hypothetical protein [Chitinivorax tropicus]MBB5018841.1 hypothetical protein [Chitinivorax tropicus]